MQINIKSTILSFAALLLLTSCNSGYQKADVYANTQVQIFPDYTGVTLPVNIAPANFRINQEGDAYQVVMTAGGKEYYREASTDNEVIIPEDSWHKMLADNKNGKIQIAVGVKRDGKWTEYKPITNYVSGDTIDQYLVYRLLYPGYDLWNEMGIYQRNLTNYDETPILENRDFGKQCINCHTFRQNSTHDFMLHVRGKNGGTLISHDGKVKEVAPKCPTVKMGATYAGWHPSGQFIAFSMNEIQ